MPPPGLSPRRAGAETSTWGALRLGGPLRTRASPEAAPGFQRPVIPALLAPALLLFQAPGAATPEASQPPVSLRATLASLYNDPYGPERFAELPIPSGGQIDELFLLLRDPREDVRQRAAALLARVEGLNEWPYQMEDRLACARAARALGWWDTALLKWIEGADPNLRFDAAYAFADGSPESVFTLLGLLGYGDADVRVVAAEGIAWAIWTHAFGKTALEHPGGRTLDLAACVVIAEGLDEIEQALADRDVRVGRWAALIARKLGMRAEPLRGALVRAAWDADPSVRCLASAALARIDAGPWPGLLDLAALERSVRPLAGASRAELEEVLREEARWHLTRDAHLPDEPDLRFEAAYELARTDLASLREHAQDEPAGGSSSLVLDGMQAALTQHVDLLLRAARQHDEEAVAAALALGPLVLPGLEHDVLRDGRFPYGWGIYDELIQILAGLGEPALPIVIEWLTAGGEIERYEAADTLAAFGPAALPAAPFLISAWRNGDSGSGVPGSDAFWECDFVRQRQGFDGPLVGDPNAAWAAMGPGAIPFLENALDDPHARVRRRACKALGGLDPALAYTALPRLRLLVADSDPTVGVAAAHAVLALGGDADPRAKEARARIARGEDG